MARTLGTAYHIATEEMCDIISVQGGEWELTGQWSGDMHYVLDTTLIESVWPETDVVENINELINAGFAVYEAYRMISLVTANDEWAQTLLKVWADLY